MKLAIPVLVLIVALGIYFAAHRASKVSETEFPAGQQKPANVSLPGELSLEGKRIEPANFDSGTTTNASREELEKQIEALTDASIKSDSNSFQLIVNALGDQRPEIREAARESAIQFGSRDAIPFLKDAAAKTDDPHEKVEILNAIEFLALPPFSEIRASRRTNSSPRLVPK